MPRKPRLEKKTITVVMEGAPITVTLHPPTGCRRSWYAYWTGLVASKSTGKTAMEDAIVVAENMVQGWKAGQGGKRPTPHPGMVFVKFCEIRKRRANSISQGSHKLFSCLAL
jgi:hypothetical protein